MTISAKIICDSLGPSGVRLTSFELCYPRFIHSELMTHRAFSRNAASSRAIPIEKMLKRIQDDPAGPIFWAANQKGMQAVVEVSNAAKEAAQIAWLAACDEAVASSRYLASLGIHKAIANRLTEPFQHMVTLVSATDFANFFHLRYHPAAQQEFQALAKLMYERYHEHEPLELREGDWHMPYIGGMEMATQGPERLRKISVGRCARTSYVNQDGVRDVEDDIGLHDRLLATPDSGEPGHWSPFEHVAQALPFPKPCGNFRGWVQYRKMFSNENTTVMPKLGER